MRKFYLILVIPLLIVSCYYDVEEELYPDGCNTTNVSYSGDVLPVLKSTCYVCHSSVAAQGGVILEGYDSLKRHVDSGKFLSAIKQDGNAAAMPQSGPKLPECTIMKIEKWISNGAAND